MKNKYSQMPKFAPPSALRSKIMTAVKSRGNATTEERLRLLMRENGITGWRRHLKIPGRPDFSFPAQKLVVFVDGCFWHGCPKCFTLPKANQEFWQEKIRRNRARDRRSATELRKMGWRVMRIWEHSIKKTPAREVGRLKRMLS